MKHSLRLKVVALLFAVALLLSTCAIYVSFTTYKGTMEDQYRTMTENLARTEAVALDKEALSTLTGSVMAIYREQVAAYGGAIPFDDFTDAEWDSYFSAYDEVYALPEFTATLQILRDLTEANDVESIYVGYIDIETEMGVYIIDAAEEGACLPGTCDVFEEGDMEMVLAGNYDFPAYITNYPEYGWLVSASAGVYNGSDAYIASAFVDISMDDVVADRIAFLKHLTILLAVITLFASAFAILLVDHNVVRPIKRLAQFTRGFVSDNYSGGTDKSTDLSIRSNDEIGELFASVEQMRVDIHDYMENLTRVTAEKERIGAELDVATKIQANMLPSVFPPFPDRKEFDIYASMSPAKEVGGDFYDFFMIDDDHLALVIADVSGKGVPAALFMVIAKTLIKSRSLVSGSCSPAEILANVNNQLCENNATSMFVTVWLGIMEISTGKVVAANAGHEFPALRKANGQFELLKDRHGFVLAGMEGSRYREYEFTVEEGGTLFVYTDGVAEATSAANELFGNERLVNSLNTNPNDTPKGLIRQMHTSIDEFVGEAPQFDDITMLCIKRAKHDDAQA